MSEEVKNIRLSKAAREFNVGTSTIVEFLAKKGMSIDPSPNTKLTEEQYALVVKEYQGEKEVKKNADQLGNIAFKGKTITVETTEKPKAIEEEEEIISIKSNILSTDKKNNSYDCSNFLNCRRSFPPFRYSSCSLFSFFSSFIKSFF